jgi:hypothetical protein
MRTGGTPACTGPRLGAHLHGGARVIRCCGEKLGATAMRSTGQHACHANTARCYGALSREDPCMPRNDPEEKPHVVVSRGDCRFPTEWLPYVVSEP